MYVSSADGKKWRSTFVYGEPKACQRYVMWDILRHVKPLGAGPWFLVGDFNEAMWQAEHFSRHKRSPRLMANFHEVLSDCNVFDLGFEGVSWTYNNKQEGCKNVKVRLDRAVACPTWSLWFPECKISHILSSRYAHCPLLIQLLGSPRISKIIKHPIYEAYWEREGEALDNQVKECWYKGMQVKNLKDVANNLDRVMKYLHGWSRVHIGFPPRKLEYAHKRLNILFKRDD